MKDNRYVVKCLIVSQYIKSEKFIVDTGARFTCCNYRAIERCLEKSHFYNEKPKYIGGFVKGERVEFYRYPLKQFTIGNIDMGAQDIWITFDERVTDIILGMDILKQVIFLSNPYDQKVYFCKDADDYGKNFHIAAQGAI